MGARGPAPKRDKDRLRRNKQEVATAKVSAPGKVVAPAEDKSWCLSAKRWYRALKVSYHAQFFEPSDWAYAQWIAELITLEMEPGPPRAAMVAQIMRAQDSLLTTEASRRRLRIEILRAADDAGETKEEKEQALKQMLDPTAIYGNQD